MKVTFTQNCSFMAFAMLKQPHLLTPGQQPAAAYKAPDQLAGFQVIRLSKFVEKNLVEKVSDTSVKFLTGTFNLEQSLVQRFKDIVKHFEAQGLLSNNCEAYIELSYALDGKTLDAEISDAVIPEGTADEVKAEATKVVEAVKVK